MDMYVCVAASQGSSPVNFSLCTVLSSSSIYKKIELKSQPLKYLGKIRMSTNVEHFCVCHSHRLAFLKGKCICKEQMLSSSGCTAQGDMNSYFYLSKGGLEWENHTFHHCSEIRSFVFRPAVSFSLPSLLVEALYC